MNQILAGGDKKNESLKYPLKHFVKVKVTKSGINIQKIHTKEEKLSNVIKLIVPLLSDSGI